MIPSKEEEH
jgi:hypothetical protein